jgi:hypothetical protein
MLGVTSKAEIIHPICAEHVVPARGVRAGRGVLRARAFQGRAAAAGAYMNRNSYSPVR